MLYCPMQQLCTWRPPSPATSWLCHFPVVNTYLYAACCHNLKPSPSIALQQNLHGTPSPANGGAHLNKRKVPFHMPPYYPYY